MVDVNKIKVILESHFEIYGTYKIDPVTHKINVWGEVHMKKQRRVKKIPLQFGSVTRSFICSDMGLKTLEGSPSKVGWDFGCDNNQLTDLTHAPQQVKGSFFCGHNQLTSLMGAPSKVGGMFSCTNNPLINLSGAPDHVVDTFYLSYSAQLPLLRLCVYQDVFISAAPELVYKILQKYRAQGRPGALKAAAELIRAGYVENARW